MIKCNATGRHCHVMRTVLAYPLPKARGVLKADDGNILYRVKLPVSGWNEYVMPYCPWCGARLRPAARKVRT